MTRVAIFALCAAILAGGTCLAQTKKNSKAAARLEMIDAPLRPASAPDVPAHPSPYNFSNVQYPRIEADSRVTFRFNAPDAKRVQVSIVNVPFDMVKGSDGAWTYTSAPQAPGYHNYWMIVDGAIVVDPGTNAFIGYGHMCNGFEIPEPGVGKLRSEYAALEQQGSISDLVGRVETHLRQPRPQISRGRTKWNRDVRKRYRIERCEYRFVLACCDFQVAFRQLQICESKPRLVEDSALRKKGIDGPCSEQIEFQLRGGLPCAA